MMQRNKNSVRSKWEIIAIKHLLILFGALYFNLWKISDHHCYKFSLFLNHFHEKIFKFTNFYDCEENISSLTESWNRYFDVRNQYLFKTVRRTKQIRNYIYICFILYENAFGKMRNKNVFELWDKIMIYMGTTE